MKKVIVSLFTVVLCYGAVAQPTPLPAGLSIGDSLPDLVFHQVYNHKADTLRLSDLRGKLVILDFWNPRCLPCLKAFPKIDSLQREYGDRIQILAVSETGYRETSELFATRSGLHRPAVPFITGDTVLANLFPHIGDPYHVWIDSNRQVMHLASGAYLTREKLDFALAGQPTGIPKAAPRTTYLQTLLDTAYIDEIKFASYLVHRNSTKQFRIEKPRSAHEYTVSGSAQRLYQYVYRAMGDIDFNPLRAKRTLLLTDRPERFVQPKDLSGEALLQWLDRYSYFYQCRIPPEDSLHLFSFIKTDFERYFRLKSSIERRKVECWVLVRTSPEDRLPTHGGLKQNTFASQDPRRPPLPEIRQLVNYPYDFFSSWLASNVERLTGDPFFDESDYAGHIDISFSGEMMDNRSMQSLRRELARYDLVLKQEQRVIDILVLREY